MSVSFHSQLDELPTPAQVGWASRSNSPSAERAQLRQQLRIVQEMLEDLEPQTRVGQRHTMEKVIGVLREQIGRGLFRTGPRNEMMLSELVEHLAHEAGRPLPEVPLFRNRAEPLIALLMATT